MGFRFLSYTLATTTARTVPVYSQKHDVALVEMLKGDNQFCRVKPSAVLRKLLLSLQVPKQLSPAPEVCNKIVKRFRSEGEPEANEEGALQSAWEEFTLVENMCDLLLGSLTTGENFHGVYTLCVPLAHLEDALVRITANHLQTLKIACSEAPIRLYTPRKVIWIGS